MILCHRRKSSLDESHLLSRRMSRLAASHLLSRRKRDQHRTYPPDARAILDNTALTIPTPRAVLETGHSFSPKQRAASKRVTHSQGQENTKLAQTPPKEASSRLHQALMFQESGIATSRLLKLQVLVGSLNPAYSSFRLAALAASTYSNPRLAAALHQLTSTAEGQPSKIELTLPRWFSKQFCN